MLRLHNKFHAGVANLNVVFDLGGVVFSWRPDDIINRIFDSPETQSLVKTRIFEHNDWVELDRGTLGIEEAVSRGASRTGLPDSEIERLLNQVPRSLTPFPETIELIRSVKNSGNRLFVLSNMQFASIAYLEEQHNIWDVFDGIVISCRIQKVKPEREIYEHLLSEHRLNATETVFIDDMSENLDAASLLGIQTIQFINTAQCRQDLMSLGCI
jgi:putative hydrolase of the HAD superfamily